ncbi:helix-turn-helix domain-containing protein [Roseburia intestinalis]|uniref:Helix-turn-helix domain-containing protein n=1 Tax=Roseburia intestinalis TaxID=166486 RepID=A0A6L6XH10_9FIRM|nr:helix-turn-helix transcriptional regulator [Roseburia intestinalis]MVQ46218.1 helix-turn-helix domain-containing protein [Roseburia intestinalis]
MDMNIEMDKNTATDSITSRLADARNDLGITQKDLASATGISVKTIINIETKHG